MAALEPCAERRLRIILQTIDYKASNSLRGRVCVCVCVCVCVGVCVCSPIQILWSVAGYDGDRDIGNMVRGELCVGGVWGVCGVGGVWSGWSVIVLHWGVRVWGRWAWHSYTAVRNLRTLSKTLFGEYSQQWPANRIQTLCACVEVVKVFIIKLIIITCGVFQRYCGV